MIGKFVALFYDESKEGSNNFKMSNANLIVGEKIHQGECHFRDFSDESRGRQCAFMSN